jgi:hypothetical protein
MVENFSAVEKFSTIAPRYIKPVIIECGLLVVVKRRYGRFSIGVNSI